MLGTDPRSTAASDLSAWAGRDRAAKVAATAATVAHGWDKLDERELDRLSEALDDHGRAYLDWVCGLRGPEVHDFRGILTTMLSANRMIRSTEERAARARFAAMLARSASNLVARINLAGEAATVDLT